MTTATTSLSQQHTITDLTPEQIREELDRMHAMLTKLVEAVPRGYDYTSTPELSQRRGGSNPATDQLQDELDQMHAMLTKLVEALPRGYDYTS